MNNKKFNILIIILVLWHVFIFGHSLMPGSVSSNQSDIVVDAIKPVVDVVAPNLAISTLNLLVRKAAHITEFLILGILLYFVYNFKFKNLKLLTAIILHGLIVAISDEIIQLFIPNRAGQIQDVLIDMIGILLAVIITFSVHKIFNITKQTFNNKEIKS